jgi:cytokinesis protein
MMEAAGLQSIVRQCRTFAVDAIEKQLNMLQQTLDDDEQKLRERMDHETLRDLANPEDVFSALRQKTQDSKAQDYLLSILQHLLLVREEGSALAYYFQIIDGAVTDLVMDKQLGGGEARLGRSVERIIAQFNEADRTQHVEDELAKAHATALRLRLEKEALEEEIAQGGEGLVFSLKDKLQHLENKLQVSRDNTAKLQQQMEAQKADYEEQIEQLEAQIMELFRMLKEVGKGVDRIMEKSDGMDRKTLIDTLEKHLQRDKTISILEGRDKRRTGRSKANGKAEDDVDSEGSVDEEETPTKAGSLRRRATSNVKHSKSGKSARLTEAQRTSEAQNGRSSQFMDADEATVQEQIQQQLAQGVKIVCG